MLKRCAAAIFVFIVLVSLVLYSCGTDPSNNGSKPSEDTTGPIIANISTSDITDSSVTITWTTDELATSWVTYSLDTSYASSSTLNLSLKTSHSVTINGLSANTTYNFKVNSKNKVYIETASDPGTFTTTE